MLAVGLSDECTGSAPRLKARAECVTLWREKVTIFFGCGKLSSQLSLRIGLFFGRLASTSAAIYHQKQAQIRQPIWT